MSLSKSLTAVAVLGAAASAASAAIIPSWRVNPIPNPPPGTVPAGAISVSLMVELTGGSLFNVAGLDLKSIPAFAAAPLAFYNQTPFGTDVKPSAALVAAFPDLGFDSYVGTTSDAIPAVPGRLNGTGTAQVGTAGQFNVAWGATPNTGGSGLLEIARITFLSSSGVFLDAGGTAIPQVAGRVRDNLNPNTDVLLPNIPVAIPEPTMGFALAGLGLLALRRK